MYEKVYNFYDKLLSTKRILYTVVLLSLIYLAYWGITFNSNENYYFFYPESEYIKLENEAVRIIELNTLKPKTEYDLKMFRYNIKSNQLYMKLKNGFLSVSATVSNYGKEEQSIIFQRNYTSNITYLISNIIFLIFISVFSALLTVLILLVILLFLFFMTILGEGINTIFNKKT